MTDPTQPPSRPNPPAVRAPYVKPELREYGPVATITASLGAKANPDGGSPPLPTMVNAS